MRTGGGGAWENGRRAAGRGPGNSPPAFERATQGAADSKANGRPASSQPSPAQGPGGVCGGGGGGGGQRTLRYPQGEPRRPLGASTARGPLGVTRGQAGGPAIAL